MNIQATFEGRPGKWSAWIFKIPESRFCFTALNVRIQNKKYCIPARHITGKKKLSDILASDSSKFKKNDIIKLDENLARIKASFTAIEVNDNTSSVIEVQCGTRAVYCFVDEDCGFDEVFMKPLVPSLSAQGRFSGVVVTDKVHELTFVIDPAYLVYGQQGSGGSPDAA